MLIFRGGAVSRDDVSPSVLQAHVEKWYAWADELAGEGRRNSGTPLTGGGKAVRGHERVVTDGPYAESKDLVTDALVSAMEAWRFGPPRDAKAWIVRAARNRAIDIIRRERRGMSLLPELASMTA